MGQVDRPKTGDLREGGSPEEDGAGEEGGLDAIAEYGRGRYDPETGLYEHYEIPDHHPARRTAREGHRGEFTLTDLIAQWELLEPDFHQVYGADLDECRHKSWRWFRVRLHGLMSDPSTRLWRYFASITPDLDDQPDDGEEGGQHE